jgi:uncharacterized protein (TIGR02246 family)
MSCPASASHLAVVNDLCDQWSAAVGARDMAAMAAMFSSDAVHLLPGQPALVGIEAISQSLKGMPACLPAGELRIVFDPHNAASAGDCLTFWADSDHQLKQDGQWTTFWRGRALWVVKQTAPTRWQIAYLAIVPPTNDYKKLMKADQAE